MTPPRKTWSTEDQQPQEACASHASFERMIERALEGIDQQIAKLTDALADQSRKNAEAIGKILQNQSERREICGSQTAKIEALEKRVSEERAETLEDRKEIWAAIKKQSAIIYTGVGIAVAANIALHILSKH